METVPINQRVMDQERRRGTQRKEWVSEGWMSDCSGEGQIMRTEGGKG